MTIHMWLIHLVLLFYKLACFNFLSNILIMFHWTHQGNIIYLNLYRRDGRDQIPGGLYFNPYKIKTK